MVFKAKGKIVKKENQTYSLIKKMVKK